jgi:hypothetical protein
MTRWWPTALVMSGLLLLTACGSTVEVTGSQVVPGSVGLGDPAAPGATAAPDVSATTPEALPDDRVTQPGGLGASPGSVGPGSRPQTTAPVTTTAKPIEIGVLITDTDAFQKAAGGTSYTVITRDSIHAYLKEANAASPVARSRSSTRPSTTRHPATTPSSRRRARASRGTTTSRR